MKYQLWIVARKGLDRSALKTLLSDNFEVIECDGVEQLPNPFSVSASHVLLVTAPADPDALFFDNLQVLCRRPMAAVLLIADALNLSNLRSALEAGVRGYVLGSIEPAALRQSLALMATGEKVLPSELAEALGSAQALRTGTQIPTRGKLSLNELKVFESLARGLPNKAIANALGLSNSIIKVHVKSIFRKIGVSNRTEAAIWMLHSN